MSNVLERIVASKRREIEAAQAARPERELRAALRDAPEVRDFFAALAAPGPIKLIAEVKKASPSRGVLRAEFRPVDIARVYEAHGAACISVLTDGPFFQGSLDHLRLIRESVGLPVLRKDFLIESYQLLEARVAGADAVLLIAECLDDCNLRKLHNESIELGMTPLVELYEPANVPRVIEAGAALVGINNRDLRTFETDLGHTIRVRGELPDDCVVVAESGIHSRADVERLESAGIDAMLVGEHFMVADDIGAAVDSLLRRKP